MKYIFTVAVCFAVLLSAANAQNSTTKTNTTWGELAQNFYKNDKIGAQYLKKDNFEDVWRAVQSTVEMAKTEDEKVRAVYKIGRAHV